MLWMALLEVADLVAVSLFDAIIGVEGRWSVELGKSGISPDLKRFNCPCPAECGRRLGLCLAGTQQRRQSNGACGAGGAADEAAPAAKRIACILRNVLARMDCDPLVGE